MSPARSAVFRPSAPSVAKQRDVPLAAPRAVAPALDRERYAPPASQPMKNHHHNGPIHPKSGEVSHDTIALKAYEIWERDGQPPSRAEANWFEAENYLVSTRKWSRSDPVLPVSF